MGVENLAGTFDSEKAHPLDTGKRLSACNELKRSRNSLFAGFSNGTVKENFQEDYSEIIDNYFRISIQESETGQDLFKKKIPFALVAVGGYGRKELCLYSDIDILVLFNRKIPASAKQLTGELFYPLWDLGLELGYGVRTVKDCIKLGHTDYEVLTSLMDARFLCGDSLLYLNMVETLQKKVIEKESLKFIRWLQDRNTVRMINFGDASHQLEPNLKEGIGGLRDYHHILWMAKSLYDIRNVRDLEYLGKLSYQEYHELSNEVHFICHVRNHLHQLSGRKNDRLNFIYQEEIAKRLNYKKALKSAAVEQFLEELHTSMENIKILHRSFLYGHAVKKSPKKVNVDLADIRQGLHLHQDEIAYNSATAILEDPSILMRVFEVSAKYGITLTMDARRLTKEFLSLIDDEFRSSEKIFNSFLYILNSPNAVEILDQMFETGFLDALFPEFGEVRGRVQFDAYHIYPVGRHMLEAVSYVKNIAKEKDILLVDTYADLKNKEQLLLAAFLHDIGKTGKEHSRRGARIARNLLERVNYPEDSIEEITFLIENHLFLAETATRRDLNDEKVIIQSARTIGNIDRLKALYILTWADSKATGPRVWNEWTGNLIQEMFFKVLHILERGELATPDTSLRIAKLKRQLKKLTAHSMDKQTFEQYFEVMPPRYKLSIPAPEAVRHMELVEELKRRLFEGETAPFIFEFRENTIGGFCEVCFIAKDRPGLFSDIAGVMALNNINILNANIYTWRDNTAVDLFSVTRPLDNINPQETWNRIERDFGKIADGKLAISSRLSTKAAPGIGTFKKPEKPTKINIDNASSDFFTLIEVFSTDKVGLLYLITKTLFDLHLDIRIAKIGNKGDQSADIFYVNDFEGQKIEDETQIGEIKNALLHQLDKTDITP
ncbi:MAG: [protein-PII] uridylyltransferase [Deltaproteobacteria bacterium]|nr:[protein-PII] uridylyltransferase [Deltaproteobacteria bacterium]